MARGVSRSTDERIAEIEAKINKKKEDIAALQDKRNALIEAKKNEKATVILQMVEQKGIAFDDVIAWIQSQPTAEIV